MKKLLLFVLCILSVSAFAQHKGGFVKKQSPKNRTEQRLKAKRMPVAIPATRADGDKLRLSHIDRFSPYDMDNTYWKETFEYKGDVTTQYSSEWEKNGSEPKEYDMKMEYAYNNDGLQTLEAEYRWIGDMKNGRWMGDFKNVTEVTSNTLTFIEYEWEDAIEDWEEAARQAYTVDDNNRMIAFTATGMWDDEIEEYVPIEAEVTQGEKGANIITIYRKNPDNTREAWMRQEITFRGDPRLVQTSLVDMYLWMGDKWMKVYSEECTYNDKNYLTQRIGRETYEVGDLVFGEKWKDVYTYTQYNDIETETYYSAEGSDEWEISYMEKHEYTYDANGNIQHCKSYYDSNYDGLITNDEVYELSDYYYTSTGIGTIGAEETVQVLLSPGEDCVTVVLSQATGSQGAIKILNSTGQVFVNQEIASGQTVSVAALPPGIYLYQVETAGRVFTGKLLKSK